MNVSFTGYFRKPNLNRQKIQSTEKIRFATLNSDRLNDNKMEKVNLKQKFQMFTEHWSPKIVGELNGQHVKLAKLKGEFVWHKHDHEDELFFVVNGNFKMEYRDSTVVVNENEFLIVPKGVEHRPVADQEVWVMLFEPATTLNTGGTENELTMHLLDRI
jgi:mannose-6-phosphate isomerase-like protein (cupin superfamily)